MAGNFTKAIRSALPSWAGGISVEKKPKAQLRAEAVIETGNWNFLFSTSFTGEKNMGELGPPKNYRPAYEILRIYSWQLMLESDITQAIMKRYCTWMIGSGLKLQAEPSQKVLESEGVTLDVHKFREQIEAYFAVYKKSSQSDHSGMNHLDKIAKRAYRNAIVGGDVLVILRYVNNDVTVQLIDGSHVQSPVYGTEFFPYKTQDGNYIINGIEQSPSGQHVRYHIRTADLTFTTVEARSENLGLQMAFMVYGMEHRLDNNRGMPLLSVVMETLKQMERYKDATVGSAEERAKVPYTIEHTLGSTGENPLIQQVAKAFDPDRNNDEIPIDIQGRELANKVAISTNKQVFNMPINSALKALDSKTELYFKDFFTTNANVVCATLEIPPEVAFSKYDSNFSSARAAIKDWENTLLIGRDDFSDQFYQKIYNFKLEILIYQKKVQAPGYLLAKKENNHNVLNAYRKARFTGPPVPHIDPLKEVKAVRERLGSAAQHLPLMTLEEATEELNGGESSANLVQFSKELEEADKLNIKPLVTATDAPIDEHTGE